MPLLVVLGIAAAACVAAFAWIAAQRESESDRATTDELLAALESDDRDAVRAAAERLVELRAVEAVPRLLRTLERRPEFLGYLGTHNENSPAMHGARGWREQDHGFGLWTTDLVRVLGEEAPESIASDVVPELVRALESDSPAAIFAACDAVRETGPPDASAAVPVLVRRVARESLPVPREQHHYMKDRLVGALSEIALETVRGSLAPDAASTALAVRAVPRRLFARERFVKRLFEHTPAYSRGRWSPRRPTPVAMFRDLLFSPDATDRRDGVCLVASYSRGEEAARVLAEKLVGDAAVRVRESAAQAFAQDEDLAMHAVPELVRALRDDDATVRRDATIALGGVPSAGATSAPELIALLDDGDPNLRTTAVLSLGRLGEHAAPAVPPLLDRLERGVGSRRHEAALVEALSRLDVRDERFLRVLLRLVDARPGDIDLEVIDALAAFGEAAAPAVPALAKLLPDESMELGMSVLATLTAIGPAARAALPEIAAEVRLRIAAETEPGLAVDAYLSIARPSGDAAAPLAEIARKLNLDEPGGWTLIEPLTRHGVAARAFAPALREALATRARAPEFNHGDITPVVEALGEVDPAATETIPQLLGLWPLYRRDPDELDGGAPISFDAFDEEDGPELAAGFLAALVDVGVDHPRAPEVAAFLRAVLERPADPGPMRPVVIELLGELRAIESIPTLRRALVGTDRRARQEAALALAAFADDAVEAVPDLVRAVADIDPRVRRAAAEAIGAIGSIAVNDGAEANVVGTLRTALGDESVRVRRAAAEALSEIGPDASAAVPSLIDSLDDDDLLVRERAIEALGLLGPVARLAIPRLEKLLDDPPLQAAARKALRRLGGRER